MDSQAHTDYYA